MSKQMLKAAGTVCLFLALLLGSTPAFAQNVTVKGNVKDAAGVPVIGASVIQQGTMNGVITDIDGNYQITVPASSSLQFTSVGYVEQVIAVEGKSVINVVLAEDTELRRELRPLAERHLGVVQVALRDRRNALPKPHVPAVHVRCGIVLRIAQLLRHR